MITMFKHKDITILAPLLSSCLYTVPFICIR